MKSCTSSNRSYSFNFKKKLCVGALAVIALPAFSQFNVTEIITDYNGYWKSAATAVNSVKPDNSHNLLSFSFNGHRYSTGVNDALLASQGDIFIAGDYRALAVTNPAAPNSNTKIGLGYMYDGVANGASTPKPVNNISTYLTDGIKGLNLGTCVANLPAGTLNFPVDKIIAASAGDGIPDIVITQIADPSGSMDRYEFTDINGVRVGNYVDIMLTNIPSIGNWTADFYEASQNPMTLAGGYTRTDRPIRLWASDLSAFGINAANAAQVKYFKIGLSGNSDVAFVAYNASSVNLIATLLPVKLTEFTCKQSNSGVQLTWQTATEINSSAFIIERSEDGSSFASIASAKAGNNGSGATDYIYADKNPVPGRNYYRLKMVDNDGHFEYSKIIALTMGANTLSSIGVFPNPAKAYVVLNHPYAGNNERVRLISVQGNTVLQRKITPGTLQTRLDLPQVPAGLYEMVWTDGKTNQVHTLVVQ